jgi:hypothetical protein
MHRVGAADRLRRGLAEADVEDLALLDQLGHRPHGLLDLHLGVDPVLVVQVNVVGPEPLQRSLDRAAHMLGGPVKGSERRQVTRLRRRLDPAGELGGDHILVPAALDRPADQLLVGHRPVQLRGVEEVDPQLQRSLDRGDRLVLVGRPVEGRHPHAAEPEGGDLQ